MHPHAKGLARHLTRHSRLLVALSYRLRGIRGLSLPALDARLDAAMAGNAEVTPEILADLNRFFLEPPRDPGLSADPFSKEYAAAQKRLYTLVASKEYSVENEATPFDFERDKDHFFPYNTRNADFVGGQLLSHGFLIRNLGVKPGARIVEFGAGWGNSTQHLAMMGYEMTAVEPNKPSSALMRYRAGLHGRTIRTEERDMVEFALNTKERFDAALFVACFHHCHDHLALLSSLDRIIEDGGTVIFADEPIVPVRSPTVPYPWGLRMDGISLYYIRRWGWLELGFTQGYFREALGRAGWEARVIPSSIEGVGDLLVARKSRRNRRLTPPG